MKYRLLSLILTLVLLNKVSFAQEASQHLEAAKCSAGFFVLTSISDKEPKLGQYFEKQKIFSDSVAVSFYKSNIKKTVNEADKKLLQEYGLTWVDEFVSSSSVYIPQFISDCISWNYLIHKTLDVELVNNSINSNQIPNHVLMAEYPHGNFQNLIPIIKEALNIWIENGKPMPKMLVPVQKKEADIYECFNFNEDGYLPKSCEISPFDEAKITCGNFHFVMRDFRNIVGKKEFIEKQRSIHMGFEESSEQYGNCVLALIEHHVPDNTKAYKTDEAISYIPSTQLLNAGVNCLEIGFKFNTPKYGKCVLRLLE